MDRTTRTYVIYFGLIIFCFFLAGRAEKKNNKKLIFLIAVALSFVSGYRKYTVGIDTSSYYFTFKSINSISDCLKYNDQGFYIIAYLLMKINNNGHFPILIFSIVINFLMVYRLWDFKGLSSYKYAVLRYITIFYFFSFNCMRQFLSISIVFMGTRYLDKGQYGRFLTCVIIAAFIHASALLSVIFLFFEASKWKQLSTRQRNLISLSVLLIPFYIIVVYYLAQGRYERYFSVTNISSYSSLLIKFVLLIFVSFIFYYDKNEKRKGKKMWMIILFYAIGLIGNILGTFYRYMERIGYYFYVYSTVYTGIVANYKKYFWLFRIIILIIIVRAFIINCNTNSMGQVPFMFNWE